MTLPQVLRSVPLFAELPEAMVEEIAAMGTVVKLPKDQHLMRQGEVGDALYAILKGRLEVYSQDGAQTQTLAIRKRYEIVGEIALLDDQPRTASIRARTDCRLFRLARDEFRGLIVSRPTLAWTLLQGLTRRTRSVLAREQNLAHDLRVSNDKLLRFNERLSQRVRQTTRKLQQANQQLREQTLRDALTGVFNRRYFQETIDGWMEQVQAQKKRLSLIMIDIDHFKHVNDEHGHQVGDRVLRHVADLLAKNVGRGQVVARYGGEEFAVLLKSSRRTAGLLAQKLCLAVAQAAPPLRDGVAGTLTISLGVSEYPANADSVATLIEKADAALYRSKEAGRNRVTLG